MEDSFSVVWALVYKHYRSAFYSASDYKFWIREINICSSIYSNLNFAHLLTLTAFPILQELSIYHWFFLFCTICHNVDFQCVQKELLINNNMVRKIYIWMPISTNIKLKFRIISLLWKYRLWMLILKDSYSRETV